MIPRSSDKTLEKNIIHKLRTKSTWNSQNHNLSGARWIVVVRSRQSISSPGESTRTTRIENRVRASNTCRTIRRRNSMREALTGHPAVRRRHGKRLNCRLTLNYHRRLLPPYFFLRHPLRADVAIRATRDSWIHWSADVGPSRDSHSAVLYANELICRTSSRYILRRYTAPPANNEGRMRTRRIYPSTI